MEHSSQAGGFSRDDAVIKYVLFKRQCLKMLDMAEHIAKLKRSLPGSKAHPFKWLYQCCKNVLEADHVESTAKAFLESTKPGAADPATPGLSGKTTTK